MSLQDLILRIRRRLLGLRLRRRLRGRDIGFVASNCAGSRLANISGLPYNSPTVDLFLLPDDYLTFVKNLEQYRGLPFREDAAETERRGFPVARIGGGAVPEIQLFLMHFHSLEKGQAAWTRRFARLRPDQMVLVMTDKDGATQSHLERFDALPYPKILFTHRPHDELKSACYIPGYEDAEEVGDLFSDWPRLLGPLTSRRIARMLSVQR